MLTHQQRNIAMMVVGVVLAVCLATSAVCVVSQSYLLSLPMPFGYLMSVCGVYRTQPTLQIGLTWASPFLSSTIPPYGGPGSDCLILPWLPVLPQRGSLVAP